MKNKLVKGTIILLIGGFITKIFSMVIRIILTKTVGTSGLGLYMLILPTFNLFITLSSLGLQTAISKLVSEHIKNNKKIILSIIPVVILLNLALIIILYLIAPTLSTVLLQNKETYYPLIAIGLTLPFICISGIIRGYFFGKEKMIPPTVATIIEQIVRLTLTVTIIPALMKNSITIAITGVVIINVASELASILTSFFYLPKNINISLSDIKHDKQYVKDVFSIGLPTTTSRLVGSLGYFLEPIIITFIFNKLGYTSNYITEEYAIVSGYVLPVLLLPSFFTLAISNVILPVVSSSYAKKQYSYTKIKIKQACFISLLVGVPLSIIFFLFPSQILNLMYSTNVGAQYLRISSIFFLIYYLQSPLTSVLQAIDKSKSAMNGTIYGTIIKTLLIILLPTLKLGMWSLLIATIASILVTTIHHYIVVKKCLQKHF
ncbi:MAG: oligosaccharide flippase family protein [bacterium]|nr:oligosaccharide flippase family protein [bacterium]